MPQQIDDFKLSLLISEHVPEPDWVSFSPADWELIVQQARGRGVASLLYWRLTQTGRIKLLPEPLVNSLRAAYHSVRMQNGQVIKETETLTRLFDQAEIPTVALKGICFLLTIYPDIGLRPMADLDLLVPASKLSEAVRIAGSSGYVEAVPEASPGLENLLNHAVCLQKKDPPFTVLELHHSLVADRSFIYAVPVDWFWGQLEPMIASPEGIKIDHLRMLTPTAQVLYASAHVMLQHGSRNSSLRWYYDLDRLVRTYADRMDWELLLFQAQAFEWNSAVAAALFQTAAFFDTPVPQKVLDDLSKHPDRSARRVEDLQNQPATHTLEEARKLRSLDGYGRFRLILALIAPSPAYMRWRYGLKTSLALPAYYLFRWWGIFGDALRTVLHLARRDRHTDERAPWNPS